MLISSIWDIKEPTHYSRRVGHEVPGVVAVLYCCEGHKLDNSQWVTYVTFIK